MKLVVRLRSLYLLYSKGLSHHQSTSVIPPFNTPHPLHCPQRREMNPAPEILYPYASRIINPAPSLLLRKNIILERTHLLRSHVTVRRHTPSLHAPCPGKKKNPSRHVPKFARGKCVWESNIKGSFRFVNMHPAGDGGKVFRTIPEFLPPRFVVCLSNFLINTFFSFLFSKPIIDTYKKNPWWTFLKK